MLVLRKEMEIHEFEEEFSFELQGLSDEAVAIIYDSLCEVLLDGETTVDSVSDYIRFQVQVMSLEEVINDYGYNMDLDDVEEDDIIDTVKKYIDDRTYLLGFYEEDETTFFIFDEF